ncbi:MAG TPA: choice-of-anchor Q domain-containing protein, partial [bacterium]|nr:choice-of-anchor Q domain-containing protein [bacterium]
FEPDTYDCEWACNLNYTHVDSTCVADTRRTSCTDIPAHAAGINSNSDGKFEQTWNEDSGTEGEWLPATVTCEWACNLNYDKVDGSCVAKTQTADCVNEIPENTVYANSGKFDQTWDGDSEVWLPLPENFECEWECAKGYQLNETEDGCITWTTIYVDMNAEGLNNGHSWTDAFISLHSALEIATAGQEIWVAEGTYKPEACPFYRYETDCLNTRNMHFRLVPGVSVLGGFNGTETLASERDPETNIVIFSGDLNDNDTWNESSLEWENRTDNVYNVFRVAYDGEYSASTTIIDGVTISGGHADSAVEGEDWNAAGGAIQLQGKSVTIKNSLFSGNYAVMQGGAISSNEGSNLVIKNTIFDKNTTRVSAAETDYANGGAISVDKGALSLTSCDFTGNRSISGGAVTLSVAQVTIMDTFFENNYAERNGGAVYSNTSDIDVTGSYFHMNGTSVLETGYHQGGAINFYSGMLTLTDTDFESNFSIESAAIQMDTPDAGSKFTSCNFTYNSVTYTEHSDNAVIKIETGGNLAVEGCVFDNNYGTPVRIKNGNLTIESSTFKNNVAYMAGAISNAMGNLVVNNSKFENNQAANDPNNALSGIGGALFLVGLDFETGTPAVGKTVVVNNSVFTGNSAGMWGGSVVDIYFPKTTFTNCTFYDNADSSGNSIVNGNSLDTIYNNSIIWDNVAVLEGGLPNGMSFGSSKISFQNSDVMGSGGSLAWNVSFLKSVMGGAVTTTNFVDNGGNIDANPIFIGSGDDPFMLAEGSPCVNTGSNGLVPAEITTDILGNNRIIDTTVDMGAYEFSPCDPHPCSGGTPVCIADATPQG